MVYFSIEKLSQIFHCCLKTFSYRFIAVIVSILWFCNENTASHENIFRAFRRNLQQYFSTEISTEIKSKESYPFHSTFVLKKLTWRREKAADAIQAAPNEGKGDDARQYTARRAMAHPLASINYFDAITLPDTKYLRMKLSNQSL